MRQLLAELLPAAMLGLFVAMPFGPVCLMCVQRTLALGLWFGMATGMGAAVTHGLFSCLAGASAAVLAGTTITAERPLGIAGGLALVFTGFRAWFVPTHPKREAGGKRLCSAFLSALLIAAANPMTMLPYLAIAAAPQAEGPLITGRAFAAPVAAMLGSASWYLVLTLGAKAMARNLQKATLDRLNILAGILLIGLGVALIGRIV